MPEVFTSKIDWSAGDWSRSNRRYLSSEIEPAIEIAEDYVVNVLGLDNTPTKVGVYYSRREDEARGSSLSESALELYFKGSEVKRRKLGSIFGEITTTIVHERIHCERARYFPDSTILEAIISEGFAHTGQAYAQQDIFSMPIENTIFGGEIDGEGLAAELMADEGYLSLMAKPKRVRKLRPTGKPDLPERRRLMKKMGSKDPQTQWLVDAPRNNYTWGSLLGAWSVRSSIEDFGYDFPMLMKMPPEEIIAL